MQQQGRGVNQRLSYLVSLHLAASGVGPQYLDNAVLGGCVYLDHCDAGGGIRGDAHPGNVYAVTRQGLLQLLAERIASYPADQCRSRSHPGGGHRLVGPFSSGVCQEPVPNHGLTGLGKAAGHSDQIYVDSTQHNHAAGSKCCILRHKTSTFGTTRFSTGILHPCSVPRH